MRRLRLFTTGLCALLTACTAQTPVIEPSTPAPTVPASPTPEAKPRRIPVARWAVYSTGEGIVLYDAKADSVRLVAEGEGLAQPRFVSEKVISFLARSQTSTRASLRTLDLSNSAQQELFFESDGIDVYDVSPDGQRVAYITRDEQAYPHLRIKTLVGTRATKAVTTLARALGRGAGQDDQIKIEFDARGEHILVVFTYADGSGDEPDERSQLQVRAFDGRLVYAPSHPSDPTMAAWAAKYKWIYLRTNEGVRGFRLGDGRVESVSSERWYNPSVSRDGGRIAFDTGADRPRVRIRILDLSTGGTSTVGPAGRFAPVFATSKVVWAQEVVRCREDCPTRAIPSERVYKINLNSGAEKPLAITDLADADVWYD